MDWLCAFHHTLECVVPFGLAGAGNVWVNTGDERLDVGLCVKHGPKSLCVPDYVQAQPDNTGWTYSQALLAVITQYKVHSASELGRRLCHCRLTTNHAQLYLLQYCSKTCMVVFTGV